MTAFLKAISVTQQATVVNTVEAMQATFGRFLIASQLQTSLAKLQSPTGIVAVSGGCSYPLNLSCRREQRCRTRVWFNDYRNGLIY